MVRSTLRVIGAATSTTLMIPGAQRRFNRHLVLLVSAAFFCVMAARAQVLTPSSMTLIGVGASGKATFIALPDCPANLRVTVQDANIASVTPLTAGSVTTQVFTVTGLQVGDTVVRIDFAGTSPLCPDSGSRFLSVHVIEPPAIVQQPVGQSVSVGTDVAFSVVATGNQLRYQWRRNGVNIPGANTDTLAITNVQPANAGDYSVIVFNPAGVAVSAIASLRVTDINALDMADDFADRSTLNAPVYVGRGKNTGATRETGEPLHAGEKGTNSVWVAWRAPASGVVTLSTLGSSFDTLLGVYTGVSLTNLVEVASDNDSGGFHTSRLKFYARADTEYQIAVDGFHGAQGDIVMSLNLVPATNLLPLILTQPAAASGPTNDTVSLTIGFNSADPVNLQWFKDGLPVKALSGQLSTDTYNIAGLKKTDVGNYQVRIVPSTVPASDITFEVFSRLVRVQMHTRGDGTVVRGVFTQDKFFETTDAVAGSVQGAVSKSSRLHKQSGGPARGFRGTQIFSTVGSSKDPGEPDHCGEPGGASEWYAYQPPADGLLVLDTDGSDFDTVLAAYTGPGTDFASLVPVACDNDSGPDGQSSKAVFPVTKDTVYYIAVDGVGGTSGTAVLNYNLGVSPSITQQPAARTVSAGSGVALSVVASGTPAPLYQWRLNQVNLAGATNSGLMITNFQSVNEGDYTVTVGNFAGSVVGGPASVLLDLPMRLGTFGLDDGGQFQLRLIGQGTTNYILQTSINLTNWVSLATNAAPNGIWYFVDPNSTNSNYRFYRAIQGQ
jgi:hypothetical protein